MSSPVIDPDSAMRTRRATAKVGQSVMVTADELDLGELQFDAAVKRWRAQGGGDGFLRLRDDLEPGRRIYTWVRVRRIK